MNRHPTASERLRIAPEDEARRTIPEPASLAPAQRRTPAEAEAVREDGERAAIEAACPELIDWDRMTEAPAAHPLPGTATAFTIAMRKARFARAR